MASELLNGNLNVHIADLDEIAAYMGGDSADLWWTKERSGILADRKVLELIQEGAREQNRYDREVIRSQSIEAYASRSIRSRLKIWYTILLHPNRARMAVIMASTATRFYSMDYDDLIAKAREMNRDPDFQKKRLERKLQARLEEVEKLERRYKRVAEETAEEAQEWRDKLAEMRQ